MKIKADYVGLDIVNTLFGSAVCHGLDLHLYTHIIYLSENIEGEKDSIITGFIIISIHLEDKSDVLECLS